MNSSRYQHRLRRHQDTIPTPGVSEYEEPSSEFRARLQSEDGPLNPPLSPKAPHLVGHKDMREKLQACFAVELSPPPTELRPVPKKGGGKAGHVLADLTSVWPQPASLYLFLA
jgi:hypothetical protein